MAQTWRSRRTAQSPKNLRKRQQPSRPIFTSVIASMRFLLLPGLPDDTAPLSASTRKMIMWASSMTCRKTGWKSRFGRRLKREFLPQCRHLTASSPGIAQVYRERYGVEHDVSPECVSIVASAFSSPSKSGMATRCPFTGFPKRSGQAGASSWS